MTGPRILLRDVLVVHPEEARPADILIAGGVIDAVRPGLPSANAAEVVEGAGLIAIPGLVNAHYHSHDALMKGSFDVMPLERWAVRALPRFLPPRSDRELRLRTRLGAMECLRGGITTVQDMLSLWPLTRDQALVVRDAYAGTGLRTVLGLQLADRGIVHTIPTLGDLLPPDLAATAAGPAPPPGMPDPLAELEALLAAAPAGRDDLVGWAICPSSPERCSREMLLALRDIARRHGLRLYAHVAISRMEAVAARSLFAGHGGSAIAWLDSLGMLGPDLTLAHGVWLSAEEMALLARRGVQLVLNPMSNLKTRNGVSPVRGCGAAGVSFGLGCDNPSCSDAQNMFQAMKLAVLLTGIDGGSEGGPGAGAMLEAATTGGARALGLAGRVGRIEPGYRADITLLDRHDPVFLPLNDPARQLVYGEGGRGVVSVMVDGRFLLRDRRLTTIDENALRAELEAVMPAFRADFAAALRRAEALDPYLAQAEAMSRKVDLPFERMLR